MNVHYKSDKINLDMEEELAREFFDRLLDMHLFSDEIEDMIWSVSKKLGLVPGIEYCTICRRRLSLLL